MKATVRRTVDSAGESLGDTIYVWCPGCDVKDPGHSGLHGLTIEGSAGAGPTSWKWNGDLENVTLDPSILTHYPLPDGSDAYRCHSYLHNGVWEFLADSTHPLAGQHVPMVDLPDWVFG